MPHLTSAKVTFAGEFTQVSEVGVFPGKGRRRGEWRSPRANQTRSGGAQHKLVLRLCDQAPQVARCFRVAMILIAKPPSAATKI